MIVRITDLVKRYGELIAVDNVNLTISDGEILGLLGPNGAGKTTLINSMIGMTHIDSGKIKIFDMDLKKNDMEIKKDIGVVPQNLALFNDLTAYENVTYFAKLYGLRGRELKEHVREAFEFTDLWERRKGYPKQFSGGMKRRLNIACSIAHKPKLIIMDEPTVGIDPQSRNHILRAVQKLNSLGSTIIYTSHYMEEVEAICSKIVIMDKGKVIAQGTKDQLDSLITSDQVIKFNISAPNYSVVEAIKKVPDVTECVLDQNELVIVTKGRMDDSLSKIIDCITGLDNKITSINMEKTTLEDVFLTLTGRSLRD